MVVRDPVVHLCGGIFLCLPRHQHRSRSACAVRISPTADDLVWLAQRGTDQCPGPADGPWRNGGLPLTVRLGAFLVGGSADGASGLCLGGFSLLGRSSDSPIANTAGSFLWAVPFALVLILIQREHLSVDRMGAAYALLSGSLASAIGYAIWYWVRVRMTAISAGAVQLLVPVLSAALGALILGEEISLKSSISALVVLMGVIWVALTTKQGKNAA